ncbi:NAD-dependent epimerase/dehydratase family protein [Mucilaginibacter sp. RS28]|uniref:NAD-dependent epimerase/dehydratase family protein n=1 Tax=Mucilaginibacter straminoryzae TaxID=2932774 RepID=A0A9X2B9G3_9SPHI|nr:NAD-dependent epimerase/dehydratase family protein [Mucilaginibacter straminoryzae]MCJ8210421.1 NAD-dependent epimerase/dehydratase family protein [Mucilaginibacter straminoryzae]
MKKAIIAGATGLVGGELLQIILQNSDYQEVLVITRRDLGIQNPKLVQLIVNFDELDQHQHTLTADALFCCLGTTQKKTPDRKQYKKIDYEYPLNLAQIAKRNGIKQYHFISSVGADMHSSNFYLKTKGETEDALVHLHLQCLHIYQPSFLVGNRSESRLGEKIAGAVLKIVDPLLIGGLKKYRSIKAAAVAKAMYNQSMKQETGLYIHPSDHIKKLA